MRSTGASVRHCRVSRVAVGPASGVSTSFVRAARDTDGTISGENLSGATAVTFNGTAAAIISNTATKIVTTVPTGATTGHVLVTTAAGTATSTATFTVT